MGRFLNAALSFSSTLRLARRHTLILLFGVASASFFSSDAKAYSNLHYAYSCDDIAVGYRTQPSTDYSGCASGCNCSGSTTQTFTDKGPGGVCTITVTQPGYSGTCYDSTGSTMSCSCSYQGNYATGTNVVKASDCTAGEIHGAYGSYGCFPGVQCTAAAPSGTPVFTLVTDTRNTGAKTQTQTYSIGGTFVNGDVVSVAIASMGQVFNYSSTDTPSSLASKIASYYNGKALNAYSCSGGPGTATASASGSQITITHNICHGIYGLSLQWRPPVCSTPTPTPTPGSTTCNVSTTTAGSSDAPSGVRCVYDCVGPGGPLPDVNMTITAGTCSSSSNQSTAQSTGGCSAAISAISCTIVTGSSATPTPTPSPSCNMDTGGTGRVCSNNSDCCSGHCEIAGNQPFMKSRGCAAGDATCTTGPLFRSSYASGGVDPYSSGGTPPSGGTQRLTAGKVCVPSALPADYKDYVGIPAAVPALNVNKKLVLNDGTYLRCYLEASDVHRNASGCSCAAGYEAVVMSSADYALYNVALYKPGRLDVLWSQVLEAIRAQPKLAKKVSDTLGDLIPQAGACTAPPMGEPVNPYLDCPSNTNTTGTIGTCCCMNWASGGFVSKQACVCSRFPNSAGCGGSTGGAVDDGCDANSVATATMNLECEYDCIPLGAATATSCSATKTNGQKCGGGNSACSGCHAASLNSCRFVPVGGGSTTGGSTTGGSTTGGGSIADIYSDQGASPQWRSATPQGYGTGISSDASATDVVLKGTGYVLGCMKKCDATTTGRDPSNPSKCTCPAGAIWDPVNQNCKTCFEGAILDAGGNCTCPFGYIDVSTVGGPQKCRPKLPSSEYSWDSDWYPTCGAGRIPMTYDLKASSLSSGGTPKTDAVAVVNGVSYPFAQTKTVPSPDHPEYFYANLPHCGCADDVVATATPGAMPTDVPNATAADTKDVIGSRNSSGFPIQPYGAIAIPTDNNGTIDGRNGATYKAGGSVCSCPNVNERMVSLGNGKGVKCVPDVDTSDPNIRFAKFDPVNDDFDGVVKDRTPSGQVRASDGKIVSKVLLPATAGSSAATSVYERGIWKCDMGYTLDASGKCIFDKAKHMCSSTSLVSDKVGGGFDNVINKKLACCLNGFGSIGQGGVSPNKFDCIENVKNSYADFNALWASSDAAENGGQMNALMLADAAGKPVTGFYTENGVRCGEFSEFSSTAIQPGVVNPVMGAGQMNRAGGSAASDAFESKGSAIPNPSGTGFSTMVSKLGTRAKVPTTAADRRRCPILVRAALVVGCPQNSQTPNSILKTFEDKTASPVTRRCSVGSSVQVKVRVEQVWEIAGQPKQQPTDTVIDNSAASSISIDRIIQKKYGNNCPTGTHRQGDACVY